MLRFDLSVVQASVTRGLDPRVDRRKKRWIAGSSRHDAYFTMQ
jgi:hypothetical protein